MIGHALSLTHHWKKKWDWQDRLNQSRFSFWGWKVTSRIIVMRTSKKGYRVPMDLGNVCVVDLVGFLWVLFCSWCFPPLPCRFLGVGGGGSLSHLHLRMSGGNETLTSDSETPFSPLHYDQKPQIQAWLPCLQVSGAIFPKLPLSRKVRLQLCKPEILYK